MKECGVCYEIKLQKYFPCSHSVCHECYEKLQGDNCPFCRQQFREPTVNSFFQRGTEYSDPEYWRDYQRGDWVAYSRYLRNGNEIIRVFRNTEVPESWRNDEMTTIVRKRRLRRFRRS